MVYLKPIILRSKIMGQMLVSPASKSINPTNELSIQPCSGIRKTAQLINKAVVNRNILSA